MNDDKLAEEFIREHGWDKHNGFVVDMDAIRDCPEDWTKMYVEDLDDYIQKATYWATEGNDYETCFEDIWDVVEFIENNSEENFDKWKELRKMPCKTDKGNQTLGA